MVRAQMCIQSGELRLADQLIESACEKLAPQEADLTARDIDGIACLAAAHLDLEPRLKFLEEYNRMKYDPIIIKWLRRQAAIGEADRKEKGMDPVTDYILKAGPEDIAEMCEAMGTTPDAEANWVSETIKRTLLSVEHPAYCDKAEDKMHYFPIQSGGRGPCVHCGRRIKEANG